MKKNLFTLGVFFFIVYSSVAQQWHNGSNGSIYTYSAVGVGTMDNQWPLRVHSNTAAVIPITGNAPGIIFNNSSTTDLFTLMYSAAIGLATQNSNYFPSAIPGDFNIRGGIGGDVLFGTLGNSNNSIERMRIKQDGNININNSLSVGNSISSPTVNASIKLTTPLINSASIVNTSSITSPTINSTNLNISNGLKIGNKAIPVGYLLSVDGKAICTELKVKASNAWPDYVFEDTYALRSINELEIFVKENNHLPNIPSAKEIEEDGIEVGDMSSRLLEKIEELTLYMIAINKENIVLRKELDALKEKYNQ
ncbi:hypothetical protein [Flavobacterium sp. HNIBRBA15423]|uniref:hypothetical protein n=1 Tax=Flavobacterium sp. HNIBRBA15423 TaxID=3458683 RepID=UPI0040444884